MVKQLKRRRIPTLPDGDRVVAALARMKSGASDEDIETVRDAIGTLFTMRDQVAAMSDAELTEWLAEMRRRLR